MKMEDMELSLLCEHATDVAAMLKLLANPQRLVLLCRLREGEASVTELIDLCGLSQSSVSQHLAKMREGGILQTRRDAQTIYYSSSAESVMKVLETLESLYTEAEPAKSAA